MTQTLKKRSFEVDGIAEYYRKYYKAQNRIRPLILNYLFRNITFLTHREKVRAININEYQLISKELNMPEILIHKFISRFLIDLLKFKKLLRSYPDILHSKMQTLNIFLGKIYRMAPIFNYKRAKENAKRLKLKLDNIYFWPQVMTQLTVIIFITDLLDKTQPQKIIQANLRALCSCSAYAFHRTRNKIGMTPNYFKSMSI